LILNDKFHIVIIGNMKWFSDFDFKNVSALAITEASECEDEFGFNNDIMYPLNNIW